MCMGIMFMFAGANSASATDVWVKQMDYHNARYDIYIMDDTITHSSDSNGKGFSVSVKLVQNGQLKQVAVNHYSKFRSDMWRYSSSLMSPNHDTVVIPQDKVFEYVMHQIGWSYYIKDRFYYY